MNIFLVDLVLPDILDLNFIALIPKQREHVNKLMGKGILHSYSLAMDRTHVWTIIHAESDEEVENILATFPLIDFVKVRVYPLAFHDNKQPALPAFSLN